MGDVRMTCGGGTGIDADRNPRLWRMGAAIGKVTRRQILGLGLGAASTAVLTAVLTACGSGRPDPNTLAIQQQSTPTGGATPVGPTPTSTSMVSPATTVLTDVPVDPSTVAATYDGLIPQQWGLDVDGVHGRLVNSGSASAPTLALTFDACGGPGGSGVDDELLEVLTGAGVPATLFLNLRWITANPRVVERLAVNPLFELANHGSRHLPLSVDGRSAYGIGGTRSAAEAVDEVWENHEVLTSITGSPPRWFRSGTAHYDEVATKVAVALGEQPVGFTTNGDFGATASSDQVRAQLVVAPAGGIVIAHMNQPGSGTAAGVASAVAYLQASGADFVTLGAGGGTRV